jgi:hypothetical protein
LFREAKVRKQTVNFEERKKVYLNSFSLILICEEPRPVGHVQDEKFYSLSQQHWGLSADHLLVKEHKSLTLP